MQDTVALAGCVINKVHFSFLIVTHYILDLTNQCFNITGFE